MNTPKREARRERIEDAAYAVLKEVGYRRASMLAIARRAGASNETLYNWYENKQNLFRSLVEANAAEVRNLLESALVEERDPLVSLAEAGKLILQLVTGERAIALNRAAAGDVDDTATLGPSIAAAGRDTLAPLVMTVLDRACANGLVECPDLGEAVEVYFGLLIGDLQVRRVIGTIEELTPDQASARSGRALRLFLRLYSPAPPVTPPPTPSGNRS